MLMLWFKITLAKGTIWYLPFQRITTVLVDTRLWKTKHLRKRFQNFRQSYVLSTCRIEIHQSQPAIMTYRRSEGHTGDCDWWISIRHGDNTYDWLKFWKHFHENGGKRATLAIELQTSGKVLTVFRTVLFCICAASFCQTDSDRVTAVECRMTGHHVSIKGSLSRIKHIIFVKIA